jgi:hypothetical protein
LAFLPKVGIYEKGQKARNHETMMVSSSGIEFATMLPKK